MDSERRALAKAAGDGDEAAAVALVLFLRREHDTGIFDSLGRCYSCKGSGWVALHPYWPEDRAIDATVQHVARCPYCPLGVALGEPPPKTGKAEFRPMTDLELRAVQNLNGCTFTPASAAKRIARSLEAQVPDGKITDKQAATLWGLVWNYRRQISDEELVKIAAKRIATPS